MSKNLALATLLLCGALLSGCESDQQEAAQQSLSQRSELSHAVRARSLEAPSDFLGDEVEPRVVEGFSKPIPTNDWWTSLIWPFYPGNNFGENLYAHPVVLKAVPEGLLLGHPNEASVTPDQVHYTYHFRQDLQVGVTGLAAPEIRVEDYSDWTVTPRWESGETWMKATLGHGLLFTYFETNGGEARITFPAESQVFYQQPGVLGVVVNGQPYGLFAPNSGAWEISANTATAPLNSAGYFSVALLPEADAATVERFREHAFSFVTDTIVDWRLENGEVVTDFILETEAKEGAPAPPILTLYRHQWLNSNATTEPWSFTTPRGEMKGFVGHRFTTRLPFTGVLPNLPLPANVDRPLLESFLNEVAAEGPLTDKDTYFGGKDLGKLGNLIPVAKQVGREDLATVWLDQIQNRLDDYFDGELPYRFLYDQTWQTLLAEPVAFESDKYLNDHHFHYGYMVMAAATLARYRPEWADANREAVNEMIRDAAGWDHEDARYPFLRHFDPYAGHSWASGAQNFAGGNNQESSSEAVHFASAVTLWGELTNQPAVRDLGAYLYATETDALWQYWFDRDQKVFPTGFSHSVLGIVWGGGGAYATWWTPNPEEIHGINFLPIHGGSLYLGHYPQALSRNLSHLLQEAGSLVEWRDIVWAAQAFVLPDEALQSFLTQRPVPEGGESRAHTYHWLSALQEMGSPVPDVTADISTFAVLEKNGKRAYLVYNSGSGRTVTFSDGFSAHVPSGRLVKLSAVDGESPPPETTALPDVLQEDISLPGAQSGQWVGAPHDGRKLVFEGVSAQYSGSLLGFTFPVDAGRAVGSAVQVEFRFDFEGDGRIDRREVYHYFPTDDVPGTESYLQTRGLFLSEGSYRDLDGGRVEVEFWAPIGQSEVKVLAEGSRIDWPYQQSELTGPPPEPVEPPSGVPLEADLYLGSNTLESGGLVQVLQAGDGNNHDGDPFRSQTWTRSGLWGTCPESAVHFQLPVDSGRAVANAVQARLLYDFEGDGVVDRTVTYNYFPTNDVPGFELYDSALVGSRSSGQAWREFQNGSVTLELWSALGSAPTTIDKTAVLKLPLTP